LLDSALECFAEDGIAASSLRQIAERAGATPAMLNYYFGGRDALLEAVVAARILPALAPMRAAVEMPAGDVSATLEAFVGAMFEVFSRNTWLPALWMSEVLMPGGQLRPMLTQRLGPLIPRPLAERFAAAHAAGELPKGLDPRLCVVSLIGLVLFPLAMAPVWRGIFPEMAELGPDHLRGHVLTLLEQGMTPKVGSKNLKDRKQEQNR